MSENPMDFQAKGLQSAACIICEPMAHKFHTGSLRGIFADVHAASENDVDSLPPAGGKLCETCGGAKKSRLLWEAALEDLVGVRVSSHIACSAASGRPPRQSP